MRTIGHEELKQKLDRQDHFRLVMALGEWAYQAKYIPGSLHFATMREALHSLNKEDEIAAAQGQAERAGRLFGAASRLLPATSTCRKEVHRRSAAARAHLDAATIRGRMGCRTDDDRGASNQFCVTRRLAEAMASFAYS